MEGTNIFTKGQPRRTFKIKVGKDPMDGVAAYVLDYSADHKLFSRWWFVSGMRDYVRELGDGKTLVGYGCMKCTGGRIISQPFVLKRVGKEKGWWR
ncbi:hypothetical protein TrRE_jg10521, partial [Triparma retinervis]